jgi:hypothetical protein
VGEEPGADAGWHRKPEKSGNNRTKANGAGYRPKKERGLTMTRKEAEEKIIKALEEIHDTYLTYNPNGKWLNVSIAKDYVRAENSFIYGGEDYDFPIYISKDLKKEGH